MYILPVDELNILTAGLPVYFETDSQTGQKRIKSEKDKEDILDELFDLFLMAYANGTQSANLDLGESIEPTLEMVEQAVNKKVAGMTWRERVDKYYRTGGTEYDIERIAETDMTRIFNTAVLDVGRQAQKKNKSKQIMKVWNTMQDDRVRDTHDYLESIRVPLDAEFITFDGDHAYAPGMFELPENNINCRCTITLRRG